MQLTVIHRTLITKITYIDVVSIADVKAACAALTHDDFGDCGMSKTVEIWDEENQKDITADVQPYTPNLNP